MTATLPSRSAREELAHIDTAGACGSGRHNPEMWHSVDADHVDRAKAICLIECPVLERCRDLALATREEFGVWGGLSERDRRDLRKAPQATRVECAAGHAQTEENVLANGRCRLCTAEWAANSRTRHSKATRVPCDDCGRPIGLDRAGRITKHLDMTTHTTCTGSWKPPVEVTA